MTEAGQSTKPDDFTAYRQALVEADHRASQAYDKTVLTLAGGALAISFAFLKDVVPHPRAETMHLLEWGWVALVASILAILISMMTSQKSLRRAMAQVDSGTIGSEHPGGLYAKMTEWLNWFALVTLVVGVALLVWFAVTNLRGVR